MIQITHRQMSPGGTGHEHIQSVRWYNPVSGEVRTTSRSSMVDWLRTPGARAYVCDGRTIVDVRVVNGTPPYIRTYADGTWTDNLLALPEF